MKHKILFVIVALFVGYGATAQKLFKVEVVGKGKPMIFIPGLYCSGTVWKDIVDHYKSSYECHVITIAGFDGQPAALQENFLEGVKNDVVQYVKTKKLVKPVIVGHSMGAFLGFWIAASAPGAFDKLVAVDGAPFLPALMSPKATVETSKPQAIQIRDGMINQTPEQSKQQQLQYMPMLTSKPEHVQMVAEMAGRSDMKTQGQVMYELFTTDLRTTVASIDCPVLYLGAWVAYKDYGLNHDSAIKSMASTMTNIKNAKVEVSDTAKHFIFFDEPQWFLEKTDAFLKI